jgi:hypothetical protein
MPMKWAFLACGVQEAPISSSYLELLPFSSLNKVPDFRGLFDFSLISSRRRSTKIGVRHVGEKQS